MVAAGQDGGSEVREAGSQEGPEAVEALLPRGGFSSARRFPTAWIRPMGGGSLCPKSTPVDAEHAHGTPCSGAWVNTSAVSWDYSLAKVTPKPECHSSH